MKIRVSRHIVCAWTWGLEVRADQATGSPTFVMVLRKSHPVWELAQEFLSHLPGTLPGHIADTEWFARLDSMYSADVAELEISDDMAKQLYFPIWELAQGGDDE